MSVRPRVAATAVCIRAFAGSAPSVTLTQGDDNDENNTKGEQGYD
ncbi:hypothetical protein [Devosia soli]|nr:hypothetical protein [Devosia soli]